MQAGNAMFILCINCCNLFFFFFFHLEIGLKDVLSDINCTVLCYIKNIKEIMLRKTVFVLFFFFFYKINNLSSRKLVLCQPGINTWCWKGIKVPLISKTILN